MAVKCYFSYIIQLDEDIHTIRALHYSKHSILVQAFDEVQRRSTFYLHHSARRRTQEITSVLLQAGGGGLGGDH